jgi:hypothetical protein
MKLFVVVGMHRSGTSIVSRLLNLAGAHLGPEDDLMPPKPDNPTGFWEALSIAQLHDDLVSYLGGRWDHPPVLEDHWEYRPGLEPFLTRIEGILASHFAGAEVAVWKDPRGSLFIPLWRRVVPVAGTILCLRDPAETAASLGAREGVSTEHAAALWLRYVVAAWRDDAAPLLVSFDDAVARPGELAMRLARFVGLPEPSGAVRSATGRFVDAGLRHHVVASRSTSGADPVMRLSRAVHALIEREPREVVAPILRTLSEGWQLEAGFTNEDVRARAPRCDLESSVVGFSR